MKEVTIYTDGACSGNPGPGGWGAILEYNGHMKEISGGEEMTTNNRMELMAAIRSLSLLKGWVFSWEGMGFMKKGKPVPNTDLWKELLALIRLHKVNLIWVKGHADNPYNNRCDEMAVAEWKRIRAGR